LTKGCNMPTLCLSKWEDLVLPHLVELWEAFNKVVLEASVGKVPRIPLCRTGLTALVSLYHAIIHLHKLIQSILQVEVLCSTMPAGGRVKLLPQDLPSPLQCQEVP